MSLFGFVSLFIVVISIAAIVLHNRVMKRRAPVDVHLEELEELLRRRVEILYTLSQVDTKLRDLCIQCVDLDFETIANSIADINEAYNQEQSSDSQCLEENWQKINDTTTALNNAIEAYNTFISKNPSGATMAQILGITKEEPISISTTNIKEP